MLLQEPVALKVAIERIESLECEQYSPAKEGRVYAALRSLQGVLIPRCRAFGALVTAVCA